MMGSERIWRLFKHVWKQTKKGRKEERVERKVLESVPKALWPSTAAHASPTAAQRIWPGSETQNLLESVS